MNINKTTPQKLDNKGIAHFIIAIVIVSMVSIVGVGLMVSSHANSGTRPSKRNPYTSQCPGNHIRFGSPKENTASVAARERVFGRPESSLEEVVFRGHDKDESGNELRVNKKIVNCLKAVDWDLTYKYHTDYQIREIYAYAPVGGANTTTRFHAYGAAIDINPSSNGYYIYGCSNSASSSKPRCIHDMPREWIKAFRAHGFFWGGNYKTSKDFMHFEWHGEL